MSRTRRTDEGQGRLGSTLSGLAVALGCVLFLGGFVWGAIVYQPYTVPTESMTPTIGAGDRVLAQRIDGSEVKRGDVVVFTESAWGDMPMVKRVVGVGGDRVTCCDRQGRILVNGHPIDEPYLHPGDQPSRVPFDIEVPEGRLWVMGDHRDDSRDSRDHHGDPGGGTVPVGKVIGRADWIGWPVGHWTRLRRPAEFAAVPAPGATPEAPAGRHG